MGSIYDNPVTVQAYDRYFSIPEQAINSICSQILEPLKSQQQRELNILFLGAGSGRVEIPLLHALVGLNRFNVVNVVAADQSEEMLRQFKVNLAGSFALESDAALDTESILVGRTTINLDIKRDDFSREEAFDGLDHEFDIVTAFFSLHVMSDWLTPCLRIVNYLKDGGFFLYAEESGDTRWIDNRFDNPGRIKTAFGDTLLKTSFLFWSTFHQLRGTVAGKTWDQDIIASDMSLLSWLLEKLGWRKEITIDEKWAPKKKYTLADYLSWFEENPLYNPVTADLSPSELSAIRVQLEREPFWEDYSNNLTEEIPRQEGHTIHIWSKHGTTALSRDNLSRLCQRTLIENKSEHLLRRLLLLRMRPEDIKDLSGTRRSVFRTIIRNRSYLLYKFFFRSKPLIQIDFTIWEPDDTTLKGKYFNKLDIILNSLSDASLDDYISTYTVYTNARPSEKKFFIDVIFQQQNLLNKILIRRSSNPSCEICLLPDGSVSKIEIGAPPVLQHLLDDDEWLALLGELRPITHRVSGDHRLFYNFDAIRDPFTSKERGQFKPKLDAIRQQLSGLEMLAEYQELVRIFRAEIQSKIWSETERDLLLEDDVVEVFVKSIFYLELLGYRTEHTWGRIAFLPGLFIRTDSNYKGFSCPIIVEANPCDGDNYDLLELLVWNFSQQDGLIEYAGLAAKEGMETGRLRGETAATIDALHTIKNDIDTPRSLLDRYISSGKENLLFDALSSLRFIHGSASTAYIAAMGLRHTYFFTDDDSFAVEERLAITCRIALEEALRYAEVKRGYRGGLKVTVNGKVVDVSSNAITVDEGREIQVGASWTDDWTVIDEEIRQIIRAAVGNTFNNLSFNLHLEGLIGALGEVFINVIKHGQEVREGDQVLKAIDLKFELYSEDVSGNGIKITFTNMTPDKLRGEDTRGVPLLRRFFEQLNLGRPNSFVDNHEQAGGMYRYICRCYLFPERIITRFTSTS